MSNLLSGITQALDPRTSLVMLDPRQAMGAVQGIEGQMPGMPSMGGLMGRVSPQAGALGSGMDDQLGAARRRKAGMEGSAAGAAPTLSIIGL